MRACDDLTHPHDTPLGAWMVTQDGALAAARGYAAAMSRCLWLLALVACSGGATTTSPDADVTVSADAAPTADGPLPSMPDGAPASMPDGPLAITPDGPLPGVPDARPPDAAPPDGAPAFDAAAVDAMPGPHFDVVYVWEWNANQDTSAFVTGQLGVIVNTGTVALDLSKLTVTMVTDDNADTTFSFQFNPGSTAMLPPGQSAGQASSSFALPVMGTLFDQSTWTQKTAPNFWTGLTDHTAGKYDIHGTVTLTLGSLVATLPFLIHSTNDTPSGLYFVSGKVVHAK
jgi:hypothetical protein